MGVGHFVDFFVLFFLLQKGTFFGRKRPLLMLCGGYALLLRHDLCRKCRIYALFWSGFDADFYADIEDFVQILCRFLHKKCSLEALCTPSKSEINLSIGLAY